MAHFGSRLLALLGATVLALGLASGAWAQAGVVGRIQTVAGTVTLVRGPATTPVNAGNVALRLGDTVRTGANGRARVVTTDGKRATLGPNSSVTLGRPGQAAAFQMQAGRAAYWVTGRRRTEVATPGAIAAAEGTGFEIVIAEDGTSTLTVAEGTVEYYNDQGRVQVDANQQSVARPGAAPSRPIAVDASGVLLFEGTIDNLALPLEPPRFFTPAPGTAEGFNTVLTALAERRPDVAAPAVQALATGSPNTASAALASGLYLLAQGQAAQSEQPLSQAAQLAADSPEGPTYLGLALFRQNRLQDAEVALRDAIRRQPNAYAAHAYLSSVLLARGESGPAAESARKAVELQPSSPLAREALGTVHLFSGRPAEAGKELQQAVEAQPLSPTGRLQLAKALAATDRLDEALDQATQAVTLDPQNAGARSTLGVLFMANKDPDRAEREFRYALRLAPNLASARSGLGAVAAERGSFAQALNEQKAALALDEGSVQARNNLGAALTAKGHLAEAIRELEEVTRLQPDYPLGWANLAIAYLEQNQFARAVRAGERAVQLGDRSPFLHTTLARVYMRMRRFDRALAELRRAQELDRNYPLQYFYLSQLFLLQGRDRDALRSLFRGVTLDPSTMVEQRLFARTEFRVAGGEDGLLEADARTDGRDANGKLSYFVSGAQLAEDGPRRNDDNTTRLGEGILGYEPGAKTNLVFYSSVFNDAGGRPGRVTNSGPQTPLFRSDTNGTDLELFGRTQVAPRSFLTLRTGYRRLSALGEDPLEFFTFRDFRNREDNLSLEGRWDHRLGQKNGLVAGLSYLRNEREFGGRLAAVPGPGLISVRDEDTPDLVSGYLEWHHRLGDRTELVLGPYFATHSGLAAVILPKFVGTHRLGDRNTLALLAYPMLQERNADLRPIEAWARPIRTFQLGLDDAGWIMNYEATWQRGWSRSSLFTATGFYRRAHRLLAPVVDPDFSGVNSRAFFPRAELLGGELAYEQWLTDRLSARVFGRFNETTNLQGGDLPYFPRWEAGGLLSYVDTNGIRSTLGLNYAGPRTDILFAGGPERRVGSYLTADFRVEWQWSVRRNVFFEVRDLFDRRPSFYRGYPGLGRTILGGIEFRL